MSVRRIVVTGIGLVTPLGLTAKDSWDSIIASRSGVTHITHISTDKLPCKISGSVKNFVPEHFVDPRDVRKMDRFIHFGFAAACEAVKDSNWVPQTDYEKTRTGVLIGSGIGGLGTIEETSIEFNNSPKGRVSPYFIPASLVNLLPGHVAIKYGFSGPNSAVATACASGAHAIGDAARMIKYGDADVMVAGGAEAPITHVGVAGFSAAKALVTSFNDNPEQASRPWDKNHAGFVIGEGAGVVVLEEYEHAKKRGAKIYAELIGYGLTGDAYHITSPNGIGAYRAMENALKDARITPDLINYINAHGTSTKIGDAIEFEAVQKLFAGHKNLFMSSTKSSIGHSLGAAGGVEAVFSILSLVDQIVPPTLNLEDPIDEVVNAPTKIDLVPFVAKKIPLEYVLSNSFGFGGTNASLVFKSFSE